VAADYFIACFFQRWRVEQAVTAQVFVVVADQQFECGARLLGQPRSAMHARLLFYSRVDNGQDLR
jgi:hypothetical protein